MKHTAIRGEVLDLSELSREDVWFLFDLARRALADEDDKKLHLLVACRNAYPLKGSLRVTAEVMESPLYKAARDIAWRHSVRQGKAGQEPDGEQIPVEDVVSVTEAAEMLGISRAGIVHAVQHGRLRGRKIGKTWVLLKRSVERYQVAKKRVEAGRLAHKDQGEKWVKVRSAKRPRKKKAKAKTKTKRKKSAAKIATAVRKGKSRKRARAASRR